MRQAIDTVSPYGVDVCSGVRTGGDLDIQKLEDFFKEVLQIPMIKPAVL